MLLTATCNNKHRSGDDPDKPAPPMAGTSSSHEDPELPPPDPAPAAVPPCPAAMASAGPLGPQVGPACSGTPLEPDGAAAAALDAAAEQAVAGLKPLGRAMGATVGTDPLAVGSVVLQGPPRCYTVVAACAGEASAVSTLTPAGPGSSLDGQGPDPVQICPPRTETYTVKLASSTDGASCAVGIWGD